MVCQWSNQRKPSHCMKQSFNHMEQLGLGFETCRSSKLLTAVQSKTEQGSLTDGFNIYIYIASPLQKGALVL